VLVRPLEASVAPSSRTTQDDPGSVQEGPRAAEAWCGVPAGQEGMVVSFEVGQMSRTGAN